MAGRPQLNRQVVCQTDGRIPWEGLTQVARDILGAIQPVEGQQLSRNLAAVNGNLRKRPMKFQNASGMVGMGVAAKHKIQFIQGWIRVYQGINVV
jgi:hypothetical protein